MSVLLWKWPRAERKALPPPACPPTPWPNNTNHEQSPKPALNPYLGPPGPSCRNQPACRCSPPPMLPRPAPPTRGAHIHPSRAPNGPGYRKNPSPLPEPPMLSPPQRPVPSSPLFPPPWTEPGPRRIPGRAPHPASGPVPPLKIPFPSLYSPVGISCCRPAGKQPLLRNFGMGGHGAPSQKSRGAAARGQKPGRPPPTNYGQQLTAVGQAVHPSGAPANHGLCCPRQGSFAALTRFLAKRSVVWL